MKQLTEKLIRVRQDTINCVNVITALLTIAWEHLNEAHFHVQASLSTSKDVTQDQHSLDEQKVLNDYEVELVYRN